ncbi:hypothetical protein JTM43_35430, partial [Pseudomonas aeruginosa]|nr:hypothetical protein [Pseudomonas aeruginosa]
LRSCHDLKNSLHPQALDWKTKDWGQPTWQAPDQPKGSKQSGKTTGHPRKRPFVGNFHSKRISYNQSA